MKQDIQKKTRNETSITQQEYVYMGKCLQKIPTKQTYKTDQQGLFFIWKRHQPKRTVYVERGP